MYAVLKTGGKQYRVAEGDEINVERLDGNIGDTLTLDQVMLVGEGENIQVGTPVVSGAKVQAEVKEQLKGPKIIVFKKHRRKNYRRKNGHRQQLTRLIIKSISKN